MAEIALIVGNPSSLSPSNDIPIFDLLDPDHNVTYLDDGATINVASYDAAIISASCSTGNARNRHAENIPILNLENAIFDEGYGTSGSSSGAGDATGAVKVDHYITDGYDIDDTFEVSTNSNRGYVSGWDNDVNNCLVVANDVTKAIILAIEEGENDTDGNPVVKRRVHFSFFRIAELTTAGENIFKQCVNWLLGLDGGGENFVENVSGIIQGSGSLVNTADSVENLTAVMAAAGQMVNTAQAVETLSGLFRSIGSQINTTAALENLSGVSGSQGSFGSNQQMMETLSEASQLTGAVVAGISYLEAVSGTTQNQGTIFDLKGYLENLIGVSSLSGNLNAFGGFVEILQGVIQNAFFLVNNHAAAEGLSGIIKSLSQLQESISAGLPVSRYKFHRQYNLSFNYPGYHSFTWNRKRSFAA